jgi:nitrogen regulatory protein P-II 1
MLKKIEGYIQPSRLDALKDALTAAGVSGMSVYAVQGFGRQHGYKAGEKSRPTPKFIEKTKIEIVVDEDQVDRVVQTIIRLARTGDIGAGKIFVTPVEDAIRIGTQEAGTAAIH